MKIFSTIIKNRIIEMSSYWKIYSIICFVALKLVAASRPLPNRIIPNLPIDEITLYWQSEVENAIVLDKYRRISEGEELFVTIMDRVDGGRGYQQIDGHHTAEAYRRLGRKVVPAQWYSAETAYKTGRMTLESQLLHNNSTPPVSVDKFTPKPPFGFAPTPSDAGIQAEIITAIESAVPNGVSNNNAAIDEIFTKGSPIKSGPVNPKFLPQGFGGYAAAGGVALAGVSNTCTAYQCTQARAREAVANNCSPSEVLQKGIVGGATDTFVYHGGNATALIVDVIKLPYDIANGKLDETTFGADRNYPVCSPQRFIACKIRDQFYDPSAGLPDKVRPPVQSAPFPTRGILITRQTQVD